VTGRIRLFGFLRRLCSLLISPAAFAWLAPTSFKHSVTILAKGPGLVALAVKLGSLPVASTQAI
jgi:hypothetical protein